MGPGRDVAAGDGEGEQVGESVGGAREGWDSEFGEDGGVVLVVYGGPSSESASSATTWTPELVMDAMRAGPRRGRGRLAARARPVR
jgi:hypothetical protein